MFEFFKAQILAGEYDLLKMLERITAVYATGQLTTEEFTQLRALAQEHANPIDSLAPLEERFDVILERLAAVTASVDALSARVAALEAGDDTEPGEDPEPVDPPAPSYPEWVQPLGGHDAYKTGDRVTYQGKVYESTIDGNVWAPDVYPAGWIEITEPETTEEPETETTEEE